MPSYQDYNRNKNRKKKPKIDRRKSKTKHYRIGLAAPMGSTTNIKEISGATILQFKNLEIGDQFYILKQQKDKDGNYYFRRRNKDGIWQNNLYTRIKTTKSVMSGYQYNTTVAISHRPTKGYLQSFTRVVKVVNGEPVELKEPTEVIVDANVKEDKKTFASLPLYAKFYLATDSMQMEYQKVENRINKEGLAVNAIDLILLSEIYIKPEAEIVEIEYEI